MPVVYHGAPDGGTVASKVIPGQRHVVPVVDAAATFGGGVACEHIVNGCQGPAIEAVKSDAASVPAVLHLKTLWVTETVASP